MLAKRRAFGACVIGVGLFVVACSSGAVKQTSPTTRSTGTGTAFGVPTGDPGGGTGRDVAADLGPCPHAYPKVPLGTLQYGVAGLDKNLVPIKALTVRVCEYVGTLAGEGGLSAGSAARFGLETNAFQTELPRNGPNTGCAGGPVGIVGGPTFMVTFANNSQQVTLSEQLVHDYGSSQLVSCTLTNGISYAQPTLAWVNQLQQLTAVRTPKT